jgi:hypothetical protein
MTFDELAAELAVRFAEVGGYTAALDERCIVLDWRGLRGLVVLTDDGRIFLKVATLWEDRDEEYLARPESVTARAVELFETFWRRRGIDFRSGGQAPEPL